MSRLPPNVSFSPDTTPRDLPPKPPMKSNLSKTSSSGQSGMTSGPESPYQTVGYEQGYVDVQAQGFSASNGADMRRKKSMVRPERERIDPGHRLWHYREHAQEDGVNVQPSSTGNQPYQRGGLRRGKSLLGRESDQADPQSGLNIFRRGTVRRRQSQRAPPPNPVQSNRVATPPTENCCPCLGNFAPGPKDAWMVYCFLLTCCIPGFVLSGLFGRKTPDAQRAWREKMGLVSIVFLLMGTVGFFTFGFTQVVCGLQPLRIAGGEANNGTLVINGYAYDLASWRHPAAGSAFNGTTNPIYMDEWMAGGKDASFLFQKVNRKCQGVITPSAQSSIQHDNNNNMAYYFPCNLRNQGYTAVNLTGYERNTNCHVSSKARDEFATYTPSAEIYYTWDRVADESRNLGVYKSIVMDFDLLNWLDRAQVNYPTFFDNLKSRNATFAGRDMTAYVERAQMSQYAECLSEVIQVGYVDSQSIGCVASSIVLYLSLVFILGAVVIKFGMAVVFGWCLSWRLGNFKGESYQDRMKRAAEVEAWTDDIYKAAPGYLRPNAKARKTVFFPTTSRFSKAEPMLVGSSRPQTTYMNEKSRSASMYGTKLTPPGSPMLRNSRSSTSLPFEEQNCPFPLGNVVPQPAPDFEPFGYPLVQSICLVTAYSESIDGLRTTLDSLATTDYPNSHKVILVICDGMVKGSGSKQFTPDIVLGMMTDFIEAPEEVEAHSYVAIADGHKKHNKAKVFAGFYQYDDSTVEASKQQRVPMVLVAKVGNEMERTEAKPGNRGKRDSQIVLMSFLQKVMFDERMTTLEYEFFNAMWRCTGVPPDRYETVLCVDADTKVFPDSLTRMNACMVNDTEIMGLCGETKIANKSESWVTMIQVFEYYISHHLTKAFESVFGGVTCLPGCFSMYRIKAPKGDRGYWVPILANPDICEHYSENIVDTLHKKNLLLLGEDRYLSTLMLKTFPKRKMMFCPQAVCKTVVPERFRILLSQRRRWINSTVHNLFELMLVRDLCGTFCFSMQFVVFMDLVGTLVLPAAISFTLYVLMITILPQSLTNMPKPIISLILLAFILGLPGVLIVITSRKVAYVGWMLIYILSIPIWNFVLPAYAYWHMDDFTWGETRKIAGESKEEAHGGKKGEFNSRDIVMKRWVEFERERRWKTSMTSRDDSMYDVVQRSQSPKGMPASNRYSMASTSETGFSGGHGAGFGTSESNPLFRHSTSGQSMAYIEKSDNISNLALPPRGHGHHREPSPASSDSGHRLPPPQAQYGYDYSQPQQQQYQQQQQQQYQLQPQQYHDSGYDAQGSNMNRVSLVDSGPVLAAPHDPVRRVSRHNRRSSSRNALSPLSNTSHSSQLPPGAMSQSEWPTEYNGNGSANVQAPPRL